MKDAPFLELQHRRLGEVETTEADTPQQPLRELCLLHSLHKEGQVDDEMAGCTADEREDGPREGVGVDVHTAFCVARAWVVPGAVDLAPDDAWRGSDALLHEPWALTHCGNDLEAIAACLRPGIQNELQGLGVR